MQVLTDEEIKAWLACNDGSDEIGMGRDIERLIIAKIPAAQKPVGDAERQQRDIMIAKCLYANTRLDGEQSALNAALGNLWPNAFSHGFQSAKAIYAAPKALAPLTEEQRRAIFKEVKRECEDGSEVIYTDVIDAVERAHGIGGTP